MDTNQTTGEPCPSELQTEQNVFTSEDARNVIRYVRETYQDELEFLWQRFPKNAIFRRKDTKKWYAALLVIPGRKLGLDSDGPIEILDLRIQPDDIGFIVDHQRYFPGYHMNKNHWYTICLNGSIPTDEIYQQIDTSYTLAEK
ncbi:MAG: MmcQ/YjbR family DNA-binding protein [Methanocorpusculum sp.]|nr:MmcQ/YjbR family DNA-binding protein [Methanocorpusculum sp.]